MSDGFQFVMNAVGGAILIGSVASLAAREITVQMHKSDDRRAAWCQQDHTTPECRQHWLKLNNG